jgi:acetyl-CoA acetyltransferase family protein
MQEKYPGIQFSQFAGAEMMVEKFGLSRDELDAFAFASHQKAYHATSEGYFNREIMPIEGTTPENEPVMVFADEGIRSDTSPESLSGLKTLSEGGTLTAGTSSQICDGAAAVMIVNDEGLKKLNIKPRAKIVALALAGDDPVIMLTGPIPATKTVLEKANLMIEDIDIYEVNEAFAPVPLAWAKEVGADLDKLNVNGGAMALGHPLGGTGAKLMTTLLHELERRDAKYGLQAICEGGGTANAMIIERI